MRLRRVDWVVGVLLFNFHVLRVQGGVQVVRLLTVPIRQDNHLVEVLFKLGHVSGNVVLVEDYCAVVVLVVSHAGQVIELRAVEQADHVLYVLGDVGHLVFHERDLGLFLLDLDLHLLGALGQLLPDAFFV